MNDVLTKTELASLLESQESPCVSIFLSTHPTGREGGQDPIRLKNLLKLAEERLQEKGIHKTKARALLEPAAALSADPGFWRRRSDGLAIYLSSGRLRTYRVAYAFQEGVYVADAFAIRPLLPFLSEAGRYFILALSQNEVRLVEAHRSSARDVVLEGFPMTVDEMLALGDRREESLRHHSGSSAGRGGTGAVFHGQSGGADKTRHKKDVLRFFERVDAGLSDLLKDERAPLILAGVESEIAQYRGVNTYRFLTEPALIGNPERWAIDDLREQTWEHVRPFLSARTEAALVRYRELMGSVRVSDDPVACLSAAFQGRVEALFLSSGKECWGTIGSKGMEIEFHDPRREGDVELLEKAAAEALRQRGSVYVLEEDAMPGDAVVAAVFHY
jgi:hypothetical protein